MKAIEVDELTQKRLHMKKLKRIEIEQLSEHGRGLELGTASRNHQGVVPDPEASFLELTERFPCKND